MRWDVEVKPDEFQTVSAVGVDVQGGALFFWDAGLLLGFAPGQWLTISRHEGEVK